MHSNSRVPYANADALQRLALAAALALRLTLRAGTGGGSRCQMPAR